MKGVKYLLLVSFAMLFGGCVSYQDQDTRPRFEGYPIYSNRHVPEGRVVWLAIPLSDESGVVWENSWAAYLLPYENKQKHFLVSMLGDRTDRARFSLEIDRALETYRTNRSNPDSRHAQHQRHAGYTSSAGDEEKRRLIAELHSVDF